MENKEGRTIIYPVMSWFFATLTLILITLKLLGYISMSWFWIAFVFAIPATIIVFFLVVALVLLVLLGVKRE